MMAILQAVLAVIIQSMGRILNTTFSWATVLLFGKVPENRQLYLSLIGFGSVLWLVVAIGVIFPRFGLFLLAFVPMSSSLDPTWVRWGMLAAALLLPLAVGAMSLFLLDSSRRPKGAWGKTREVLKGYPYTIGLSLTLVLMLVIAPILKLRDLFWGWTTTHIPVLVRPGDYFDVVADVERVLGRGGFETRRREAPWLLRWPTKVFTFFAGGAIENLVAERMVVLRSGRIEVLLHPSDLVLRGKQEYVARAHAVITEHLAFTKAYQTWSKEANDIEDRLAALWREFKQGPGNVNLAATFVHLATIERELQRAKVSYEEWEVLFRQKLSVERELLRARVAGLTHSRRELTAARPQESVEKNGRQGGPTERPHPLVVMSVAALVLALLWRVPARATQAGAEPQTPADGSLAGRMPGLKRMQAG